MAKPLDIATKVKIRSMNGRIPRDAASQLLLEKEVGMKFSDPAFLEEFFKGHSVGRAYEEVAFIRDGKAAAIAQEWSVKKTREAGAALDRLPASKMAKTDIFRDFKIDRKSTRLNSSHIPLSRMPSSA